MRSPGAADGGPQLGGTTRYEGATLGRAEPPPLLGTGLGRVVPPHRDVGANSPPTPLPGPLPPPPPVSSVAPSLVLAPASAPPPASVRDASDAPDEPFEAAA